jgi:multicomponent Na+:H+ antiporter subunit E
MTSNKSQQKPKGKSKYEIIISLFMQWLPLYAFWLVLSEHYTPFYLVIGALASGLIVFFNHEMFVAFYPLNNNGRITIKSALSVAWRFLKYLPGLLFQVIRDNLLVAYLVIHPKMPIDPMLLGFKTKYQRSVSHVILGNSITLSPGTMTISLENDYYLIHGLIPSCFDSMISGEAQAKVAKIFNEELQGTPVSITGHTFKEVEE